MAKESVSGCANSPAVWSWPSWSVLAWLVVVGGLGSMGHLCYVRAFSMADASAIMPYDYVRLLFAALIGWVFFAEVPDHWTLIGATVAPAFQFEHFEMAPPGWEPG